MAHIYVIAGHGAGDPGAGGNGFDEAERVRVLAQRIKDFGGDSVTLHPFSDNAYESGAIKSLGIPKDWQIVELHMDAASASARGGHVIINGKFQPDAYDMALAGYIADIFPGRSNPIVGRTDLGNANRSAARGYGYRLVENGFITNAEDVAIFNSRLDDIAKAYLKAFGIGAGEAPAASPQPAPQPAQSPQPNTTSKGGLAVDGVIGPASVKRLQEVIGAKYHDGVISGQYHSCDKYRTSVTAVEYGLSGSSTVKTLQSLIGVSADGIWGVDTSIGLQARLGDVTVDGYFGPNSAKSLQRHLNDGSL